MRNCFPLYHTCLSVIIIIIFFQSLHPLTTIDAATYKERATGLKKAKGFSFLNKKKTNNVKKIHKKSKSTSIKPKNIQRVEIDKTSLQYSLIDDDVPRAKSTSSSDTLCVGVCHPHLLESCHFDSLCLLNKIANSSTHHNFKDKNCLSLCSSNSSYKIDMINLKKQQQDVISTCRKKNKYIITRYKDLGLNNKIINNKFLWAAVIVRNSALKLLEWIVWHYLMGVQHFVVYDNTSVDNIKEALRPFIIANIVSLISNVRDVMQIKAYNHALNLCRERGVFYLMLLDVDEFILTSGSDSLLDVLLSHSLNPAVGALQLQWQFVLPPNRQGFLYKPLESMFLELLTNDFRTPSYTHPRCSTKSIIKVDLATEAHVHYSKFKNITTQSNINYHYNADNASSSESLFITNPRGVDVWGRPVDSPWSQKPCVGYKGVFVLHLLVGTLVDWVKKRENGYALIMKNGCKTCQLSFEAKVAEWQCQLRGGAMRRNQPFFDDAKSNRSRAGSKTKERQSLATTSSLAGSVPLCVPEVPGYMTLRGMRDIDFNIKSNIVVEPLNVSSDTLKRLQVMKRVLLPQISQRWERGDGKKTVPT